MPDEYFFLMAVELVETVMFYAMNCSLPEEKCCIAALL